MSSPVPCHKTGSDTRRNYAATALTLPVPHSLPEVGVSDPESAVVPMSRYLGIQILVHYCLKNIKHIIHNYYD